MQIRRKIHLLERPIHSSSSDGRPFLRLQHLQRAGGDPLARHDIFRVTYNFHLNGKQKTTPAQRLGLTDRVWTLDEILAFEGG
ncbi:MAG: hypothetical protein ACYCZD_11405 [Rhodanobacter sp.]